METVIGIYDEQMEYAKHLARYMNDCRDFGCLAVVFQSFDELEQYCSRKKLICLMTNQITEDNKEKYQSFLKEEGQLCIFSEEPVLKEIVEKQDYPEQVLYIFRYQKASKIVEQLKGVQGEPAEGTSEWYLVYSLTSRVVAEQFAWQLARKFATQGKTLFLPWEPFSAWERNEEGTKQQSVSDLLYALRESTTLTKQLFSNLPCKEGVEYFCGTDYYTDLWQYSCEEMRQLLAYCKEYGTYRHIVFLAGFISESIECVMEESQHVCILSSSTKEGDRRQKEFLRQMKYAGKQTLLSHIEIIREEDLESAVAQVVSQQKETCLNNFEGS